MLQNTTLGGSKQRVFPQEKLWWYQRDNKGLLHSCTIALIVSCLISPDGTGK